MNPTFKWFIKCILTKWSSLFWSIPELSKSILELISESDKGSPPFLTVDGEMVKISIRRNSFAMPDLFLLLVMEKSLPIISRRIQRQKIILIYFYSSKLFSLSSFEDFLYDIQNIYFHICRDWYKTFAEMTFQINLQCF